jgi:hypothetical protein
MHAIPEFPEFASLAIHHKEHMHQITHHFPTYSDFNFISLFSWDTEAAIGVSMLNNNLVVRFSDYEDNSIFLSFIGTNKLQETLTTLFDYCKRHTLPLELSLIPHTVAESIKKDTQLLEDYNIREDRDDHDYILSVKKLSELGPDFQRKRKAVNRFKSRYIDVTWQGELDLSEPKTRAEVRKVMQDWKVSRNRNENQDNKEFLAINRALEHASQLGIRIYGIRINNDLEAFTLFELTPQKVAIFHFTKANIEFEGIFEFLKHNLALHLEKLGVDFINTEQDLGVPGLRQAKESYRPVAYLKKYTVSPKS